MHIGYYDQEGRALNDEERVIDYIRNVAEYVTTNEGVQITAGKMLERFLFTPAAQYAVIGNLSGGERRRLYLLRILMSSPNVLLLDEPTNDLDIPTLIALEEYLDNFAGALIVVVTTATSSTERSTNSFASSLEATSVSTPAISQPISIREREGAEPSTEMVPKANLNFSSVTASKSKKLSFKENRELENLEQTIAAAEARLPAIEKEMISAASDAGRIHQLFTEQQVLNDQLEAHMRQWAELAERAE